MGADRRVPPPAQLGARLRSFVQTHVHHVEDVRVGGLRGTHEEVVGLDVLRDDGSKMIKRKEEKRKEEAMRISQEFASVPCMLPPLYLSPFIIVIAADSVQEVMVVMVFDSV